MIELTVRVRARSREPLRADDDKWREKMEIPALRFCAEDVAEVTELLV